jgi:hypothetical protein
VANFPTLVPPNFWTIHLASESTTLWYIVGGVCGSEEDNEEDLEQEGVESDNIVSGGNEATLKSRQE